jgi:hypothetical protein
MTSKHYLAGFCRWGWRLTGGFRNPYMPSLHKTNANCYSLLAHLLLPSCDATKLARTLVDVGKTVPALRDFMLE